VSTPGDFDERSHVIAIVIAGAQFAPALLLRTSAIRADTRSPRGGLLLKLWTVGGNQRMSSSRASVPTCAEDEAAAPTQLGIPRDGRRVVSVCNPAGRRRQVAFNAGSVSSAEYQVVVRVHPESDRWGAPTWRWTQVRDRTELPRQKRGLEPQSRSLVHQLPTG